MLTKSIVLKFLKERPAISRSKLGKDAGYKDGGRYFRNCIADDAPEELPVKLQEQILPVLEKYGYKKAAHF